MSIRPFTGEYLVSPVALHMGLNWCTHGCFYCFANLNRPGRRADYGSIQQFLGKVQRKQAGKDIAAMLALQGHPILASNDSDPFAKSNGEQNIALIEAMMDQGLRFSFQTRGGDGAIPMLERHPPTMVYISFTTDMESVRKQAEPGAPSFEARKELALAAKAAGHFVTVGIMPFFLPWWDDIEGFIEWLAAHDIRHMWVGEPHLNYMQVAAMSEKTKHRFASEIAYFKAGKSQRPSSRPLLQRMCAELGINSMSGCTSENGGFWDPYFRLGYPKWPTLEGWFDHLRTLGNSVAFTFDAFHRWADHSAGFQSAQWKDYLSGIGRSIRNVGLVQKAGTLHAVHEFLWRIHEFPTRMIHDDIYLGTQDGNLAVDSQGRFVLVYAPGQPDNDSGRFDIDACDEEIGLVEDPDPTQAKE